MHIFTGGAAGGHRKIVAGWLVDNRDTRRDIRRDVRRENERAREIQIQKECVCLCVSVRAQRESAHTRARERERQHIPERGGHCGVRVHNGPLNLIGACDALPCISDKYRSQFT